jgi:DNA-binding Lrp family transcriptional regulator
MQQNMDVKDKKLLFELDMGARQTNAQLSKKIGLSKQAIQYRIDRMKNRGIIKGFYPVINMNKLGYMYCRFFITLKDINSVKFKTITDDVAKDNRFFWIFTTHGICDFIMAMWSKTINDFRIAGEDLLSKHGQYIESLVLSIGSDVIHYQNRYLVGNKETKEIHIKETHERCLLDELDKSILRELCSDARIDIVSIASRLVVSSAVVAYRIKKMEASGLIAAYRTIFDHRKLGYTYYKLFVDVHNFTKADLQLIKEHAKLNTSTIYEVEAVGIPEVLDVEIMVASNTDLFKYIDDLRNAFPGKIGHYRSFMFTDTLKAKFYPF